jgi:hypothetical protein
MQPRLGDLEDLTTFARKGLVGDNACLYNVDRSLDLPELGT